MKFIIAITALACALPVAAQDYAAWSKKNTDGSWTAATEVAVDQSRLPELLPTDIMEFCPDYKEQDRLGRKKFWTGLISIIAKPESNFNPSAKFVENFKNSRGEFVISRGLLQISIESANQKRYACNIKQENDLHDPATNLACGVKILNSWVTNDNVIATYEKKPARGGGRYWSTLRERNNHLAEIKKFTQAMSVCAPK